MLKSTREESCRRLSDTVRTGNQNFFFQNAPALLFPAGTPTRTDSKKGTLPDALLLLVRETGLFLAAVRANGATARSGRL